MLDVEIYGYVMCIEFKPEKANKWKGNNNIRSCRLVMKKKTIV